VYNFNVEDVVKGIVEPDGNSMLKAQDKLNSLTKPLEVLEGLKSLRNKFQELQADLIRTCQRNS